MEVVVDARHVQAERRQVRKVKRRGVILLCMMALSCGCSSFGGGGEEGGGDILIL